MRLSNKGRYAVRALFDIAFYGNGSPTRVRSIARRQGIPLRFLEQIFQDLKRSRMVGSKRGPLGGYTLAQPASHIRLGDVVRSIEGPILLGGVAPPAGRAEVEGAWGPRSPTDSLLYDLSVRIEACLDAVSIADVCERARQLGLQPNGWAER
jgi:Rrf2 family protein